MWLILDEDVRATVEKLLSQLGIYFVLFFSGSLWLSSCKKPDSEDKSFYARFLRIAVFGHQAGEVQEKEETGKKNHSRQKTIGTVVYCSTGLLISYLSWGLLQEKLVSYEYSNGRFESSTFLVFCNRIFACLVSGVIVFKNRESDPLRAPLFPTSYVSLSNILSSWCQIESLRYVSFPVQVLAKSSKVIPVMLMGRILRGKRYQMYEYIMAITICIGATMFMFSQSNGGGRGTVSTSLIGYILLGLYLVSDSCTSQWQGHLFATYDMSPNHMMLGVNIFSSLFTLVSLIQTGELNSSLIFLLENPDCMLHVSLFSLASVVGQSFIFFTIKELGPMFFTMIMTARQIISIILSCLVFEHSISIDGIVGASLVFAAIGYQIYEKTSPKTTSPTKTA